MSGINITIERMTRQPALTSIVAGYIYAALLVAGPWIFTMLGIVGLSSTGCSADCDALTLFRSVVIYNSMFSLVVTSGPRLGDIEAPVTVDQRQLHEGNSVLRGQPPRVDR